MKQRTSWMICVMAALAISSTARSAEADQDSKKKLSVTVSFGAGLNTAQPGNAANHHVLPKTINVKTGGVVNFVVSGFHQVYVYRPGTEPENIVVPPAGLFINDFNNLYYLGINPGPNPPPSPLPPGVPPIPANASNAPNRVESVSFNEPGTYLVICNVRPHFLDGMIAFVRVTGDDDD